MAQTDFEDEIEAAERVRIERAAIVARYDLGRTDENNVKNIDDWEDPKFEIYHTQDRYGFIHDRRLPDKGRTEREQKQIRQEVARSLKWAEMIKEEKKYFEPKAKYREKMINRVYKGIPDSVRGKVWYILLDIDQKKKEHRGTYKQMRDLARQYSPDIRQIDLDVNRTYRDHVMFRERYNHRQQALFHVLAAYSIYNSELGYCQGMSQIAALLLMYLNEEEDVFWALSQLMVSRKYSMHGFFIQGFPKLIRFQSHHDRILKKFLPKLKKHLDRNGIDTGIYTLKWFFQCFLDRIPFSLTLRVWDLYLLEGERVMVGMAYNILRMHRRVLMKLGMDELIEHLQVNLQRDFGYDDEVAIEKLREVISELASHRLSNPGSPPPEELPQRPFGQYEHLVEADRKAGLRTGLTEKEREYSVNAIQRQEELEQRLRQNAKLGMTSASMAEEDEEEIDNISDTSLDETSSIPDMNNSRSISVTPAQHSHSRGGSRSQSSVDHRTSSASSRPHSDAIERLDDSMRLLMQTAELNGEVSDDDRDISHHQEVVKRSHQRHHSTDSGKRYSSSSMVTTTTTTTKKNAAKNNGVHSQTKLEEMRTQRKVEKVSKSTFEQKMSISKDDVVRIYVPYKPQPEGAEVTVTSTERNRTVTSSPTKRLSAPPR